MSRLGSFVLGAEAWEPAMCKAPVGKTLKHPLLTTPHFRSQFGQSLGNTWASSSGDTMNEMQKQRYLYVLYIPTRPIAANTHSCYLIQIRATIVQPCACRAVHQYRCGPWDVEECLVGCLLLLLIFVVTAYSYCRLLLPTAIAHCNFNPVESCRIL